jgi:RHS repeat-associated protein
LNIDEPYIRKGTSDEFYEVDALGSSVALTNGAGASQTTYTYQPFGSTAQSGTSSTSPFQFTGRENDGSGLYYYRARYYNPTLQRFMGEDPLRFRTLDVNLYRYVLNNPANWVDPTGLETRIVIGRTTFAPFGFDTGIGVGHVGLYVDSGIDGGPMIYDPSGSYMNDIRGSGGIFSGPDAKWPDYLRYQTQGTQVDVFVFATTPEEEQRIARRAEMLGDPRGLACAASVSQVLQGIGPFKNLDPTVFPGRLRSQLYRLLKR